MRHDVRRPVGVEGPPVDPDLGDADDLPPHRDDAGVRCEVPAAETRAVDHQVHARGPGREGREVQSRDRPSQLRDPVRQPVEVDRHLHDRRGEGPRVGVPRRHLDAATQVGDRGGPPGLTRAATQHLGSRHHLHAGPRLPGQRGELAERAGGPARDAVLGQGSVGVPQRCRDGGRRLPRQVPGQDVHAVARLQQPHRAAEPDDARTDHQHPAHGRSLASPPGRTWAGTHTDSLFASALLT